MRKTFALFTIYFQINANITKSGYCETRY